MKTTASNSSMDSASPIRPIRIVSLNREKTRKTGKEMQRTGTAVSEPVYQVYFELSESPSQGWRNLFEKEWKALNVVVHQPSREASVEGRFLVVHCPLQEIATVHLPVLKKAVAATNVSHLQYLIDQAREQDHRNDLWKIERKAVDDLAESLQFE
ncbi:MAG TPA: hypothetical protein VNL36_03900 [Bacteroidota bacterium]|nr:hypothetical protein [Bacteroidota bacterium]